MESQDELSMSDSELMRRRAAGESVAAIAAAVRMPLAEINDRLQQLQHRGWVDPVATPRQNEIARQRMYRERDERDERVIALRAAGLTTKEIAKELGYATITVSKIIQRLLAAGTVSRKPPGRRRSNPVPPTEGPDLWFTDFVTPMARG